MGLSALSFQSLEQAYVTFEIQTQASLLPIIPKQTVPFLC